MDLFDQAACVKVMEKITRVDSTPQPVEPHPVLPSYYTDRTQRPAFVRALFDRTARHYDRVNRLLSLGTGDWYRRQALLQAGLRPGMRVLDVATGTGLVARQALAITGNKDDVMGLDVSGGMLAEAGRRLGIRLIQASAERLPLADASIDFLSMGYALRHVSDLDATFREFYRVLRPGGTVLLLEIAGPPEGLRYQLLGLYLRRVIPWLSRWVTGDKEVQTLMRYYWDTIEHCVSPQTILQTLGGSGFTATSCQVDCGIFCAYRGRKV